MNKKIDQNLVWVDNLNVTTTIAALKTVNPISHMSPLYPFWFKAGASKTNMHTKNIPIAYDNPSANHKK